MTLDFVSRKELKRGKRYNQEENLIGYCNIQVRDECDFDSGCGGRKVCRDYRYILEVEMRKITYGLKVRSKGKEVSK